MASNYLQPGDTVTVTAPYNVSSGGGLKIGNFFGVALATVLSAASVEAKRSGVFSLTKVGSQAWTEFETVVYWDDTNQRCTSEAAGNMPIGVAAESVGSGAGATTGAVLLIPGMTAEGAIGTAATATADGTGTGTIAAKPFLQFVTVTSANANNIIVLPAPILGSIVILRNGGTGYELRSSDPATIAINGGTGASAESAIAANTMVIAVCTTATTWQAISLAGTTLAAVEAAA